jgi:superfamily II DNA helicase RecQ
MRKIALNYLQTALNNPEANFKDGQWESIECLLDHKRMLVVQFKAIFLMYEFYQLSLQIS